MKLITEVHTDPLTPILFISVKYWSLLVFSPDYGRLFELLEEVQGPLEVQIQFVEFAIKEAIRWVPRGTTRLQAVDSLQWLAEGWRTCLVGVDQSLLPLYSSGSWHRYLGWCHRSSGHPSRPTQPSFATVVLIWALILSRQLSYWLEHTVPRMYWLCLQMMSPCSGSHRTSYCAGSLGISFYTLCLFIFRFKRRHLIPFLEKKREEMLFQLFLQQ